MWPTKWPKFYEGKYKKEVWYDRKGKEFHPGQHYYVCGNTKTYGAILLLERLN